MHCPPASLLALALVVSCRATGARPPASATACPSVAAPVTLAPPAPADEDAARGEPIAERGRRAHAPPDCGDPEAYCTEITRLGIYQTLLDAAASEVLLAAPRSRRPRADADWDRRTITPAMRAVGDEVGLTGREWAALARTGFTVLRRVRYDNPYESFKDIYRMQLPLFVSADAVLHAVFRGHEKVIERLEPALEDTVVASLRRLRSTLATMRAELPEDAARDLDVYLAVALALATDAAPETLAPELSPEAARLATAAREATEINDRETLFGRVRVMDYTAFAPRGPYADSGERQRWFRVAHWLSRVEFNVVSRDCRSSQPGVVPVPEETPREALDAFALAAVAARAEALDPLESVSAAWRAIAGRREDMGLADLERVRAAAGVASLRDPDAFARLSAAIGASFARTARTHPMPQGVARLPVIATMLGVSVTADAAMTRPLVHDAVAQRARLGAADVAYALGHEPAGRLLAAEFARYPTLRAGFERARETLRHAGEGDDVYSAWLASLLTLATPAPGVVPSFMRSAAWGDLRTNTLAVGYGQLRHGNALYAATSYDGAACRIPDAWVEPAPELYAALRVFYDRLGALAARIAPGGNSGVGEWLAEVDRDLRVLERIARDELAGHALTEPQRRFLGYVAEVLPSSDGEPTHTGWYVEMFPHEGDAMGTSQFIADYYASTNEQEVSYVGSAGTVLGAFVVDRGGAPRLMVGPVADGYEHHGPLARRLDDRRARRLAPSERSAPWATSYALDPVASPRFAFAERGEAEGERPAALAAQLRVEAGASPGTLVVEYLSPHHRVLARGAAVVGARATPLVMRWLSGMAPPSAAASDEEGEAQRTASHEQQVCGYRLRHGSWVMTRRTDEYPFGEGCNEPTLAGERFGGAAHAPADGEESPTDAADEEAE